MGKKVTYVAYEYITKGGTRCTSIQPNSPVHSYARVLKTGTLPECQAHLYPNGDAEENYAHGTIPFIPKY